MPPKVYLLQSKWLEGINWCECLVASDEELSEPGTAQHLPASAQSFEIPLCSVCLEDRYAVVVSMYVGLEVCSVQW